MTSLTYLADELMGLRRFDSPPSRSVRKVIFSLRLWRTSRQRQHAERKHLEGFSRRHRTANASKLQLGCVNAGSMANKIATLTQTIVDDRLDILTITETWHECSDSVDLKRVTPPGYKCIDTARPLVADVNTHTDRLQNHGGLAVILRDGIKATKKTLNPTSTFEHICSHITVGTSHFILLRVYRLGSKTATAAFFDELTAVLEQLNSHRCPFVICGDFNIHVDIHDDPHAVRLVELLQSFDCLQHVTEPTHKAGHTLDLVITRSDNKISNLHVGSMVSDHATVSFEINVEKPLLEQLWTTSRLWKKLSPSAFEADLRASELCADVETLRGKSVDELSELYDTVMLALLDRHCPAVKTSRKFGPLTPWFDADCRASRRRSRQLERLYRRTRTDADRLAWIKQLRALHRLYDEKEHQHWRTKIADSKGSMKKLWRTMSDIMGESACKNNVPSTYTAENFATFFTEKVDLVRASTSTMPPHDVPHTATHILNEWTPVTPTDVEKLIGSAPSKTCQLDPVPTWLIKEHRCLLSPFIALLFNESLSTGCFPTKFKHAMVFPLLKKNSMDVNELKSFRPVSNLPFLSKLLEKVIQTQLQSFLDEHDATPRHQSAYRKHHSTETALVKVYNDLLMAADRGQVSALCLLDLTAAFDMVDHAILLLRLEHQFGVVGRAIAWFRSYLTDRTYCVTYGGNTSSTVSVTCSVPQGSVLGPLLFILYVAELAELASSFGVNLHAFADDHQLYLHCSIDDATSAASVLEQCIAAIGDWMIANRLKLNTDKTEVIWMGSRHSTRILDGCSPSLSLGADTVAAASSVRLLGITATPDLLLEKYASTVSAKCFFQLRQLRKIRRSLDTASTCTLIHAFVTSRVDYCNCLLANAPQRWTDKLQRVMNNAARIITRTRKFDRGLTDILHNQLHWLDVRYRIQFRLCVTVYKCLNGLAPQYLSELCRPVASVLGRCHLRSAARGQLVVPSYKLSTYGKRAFSYAGPSLWNTLPDAVKHSASLDIFKKQLKSFLFIQQAAHSVH